jgi:single-strand DNA-binding protein
MASLNKVQLIGNLGADPESRSFSNGGEVVNLRLATTENWKDSDGNKQERTEWHSVAIFNENLGRVAKSYLRKGSKVYIEGQLQTRKWTDKDGVEKYSTEIVLQGFNSVLTMLDGKTGQSGDEALAEPRKPATAGAEMNDEIPWCATRHYQSSSGSSAKSGKTPTPPRACSKN